MDIRSAAGRCLLALLLACSLTPAAVAGEFSAVINGRSFHLGASEDWNENNIGLGLEYRFASETRWHKQLMVNGFRDSNDEMSYMAGGGLYRTLFATDHLHGFYVEAGINAFLMTRKDVNDNRPFPGALPSLTLGNDFVGVNLTYLPKIAIEKFLDETITDDSVSGIIFLQLKFNVGKH
jgi:Antimicrobial peptide resistance and lipid A acylation protein PagP